MKRRRLLQILVLVPVLSVHAAAPQGRNRPAPEPPFHFSRLLVMPFTRAPARGEVWACPRCGRVLMACAVSEGAEAVLSRLLREELEKFAGLELVSQEELNQALRAIPEPELTQARQKPDFPFTLARQLQADAVLIPTVTCFRQRAGSAWASSRPSAVAFELELNSVAEQKVVWTGSYEEEQKPLLDDLFQAKTFFRRGAKWVTAEVLAREGMRRALADFPPAGGAAPGAGEKP